MSDEPTLLSVSMIADVLSPTEGPAIARWRVKDAIDRLGIEPAQRHPNLYLYHPRVVDQVRDEMLAKHPPPANPTLNTKAKASDA